MAKLVMMGNRHGSYTNVDAVENVIKYITRTRAYETREDELICYGGAGIGAYLPPYDIIRQFLYVQELYNIKSRKGRRIYHETLTFTDEEFRSLNGDYKEIISIAEKISHLHFASGHQVLYGIHLSKEKKLHIHFAINTINFITGLKWHSYKGDLQERECIYNDIIKQHYYIYIRKMVKLVDNYI